jgi:predicted transposase/invertase (TIGR01784 family)
MSRFNDGLPEILPPIYDIVFKLVFAKRPDLLKPLLKSVISLPDDEYGEIEIVDPNIYPEHVDEKLGVLDIKVVLKSKTVIDVEMQKEKVACLRERVLFYCAGMLREQVVSGDDYDSIKRVIGVTITNHVIIPEDGAYHHRYTLYDPETRSEFTDLLEVHILELPKLSRTDDGSELWWWMRFLTVKTKEELAMIAEKSPVLEQAATRLVEVSEDMHTRHRLESYRLYEMDQRVKARVAKREAEEAIRKVEEAKRETEEEMRKVREEMGMVKEEARKAEEKGRVEGMKKTMEFLEQGYSLEEIKRMLSEDG